jgi:catechol 2,3-dioxygenase-like lactoylglutathione lyase family enzyme
MHLGYHETVHVHHLAFRTPNVAALRSFYERVLGLSCVRESESGSVWMALGPAVLMIERRGAQEPAVPPGSMDFFAFAVNAAEKAHIRTTLAAQHVALEHETAHTLYFRDPDGRRIGVSDYSLPV